MIDVVCGVIQDGEGRYLACRRPEEKHMGRMWEFPGGKVDPGESPEEALGRELEEELGIRVVVGGPLEPVVWRYENGPIRLLPYGCRVEGGVLRALEHEEIRWVTKAEFWDLDWAPADVPVLKQLLGQNMR